AALPAVSGTGTLWSTGLGSQDSCRGDRRPRRMESTLMSSTTHGGDQPAQTGGYDFVVVANRLPLDRVEDPDGQVSWRRSPGGLVTALEPVMQQADGAWVGWTGADGPAPEPFDEAGMRLVPVSLSGEEVRD